MTDRNHTAIAADLFKLLTQSNIQVPVATVEKFVEVKNWLKDIAESRLIVVEPQEDNLSN